MPSTAGRRDSIVLRFLAAPTDVAATGGTVQAGRVLEWIDKAGYVRGRLER
jgi:acyl-CoA hydrolase